MTKRHIIIATRESPLAMRQAEMVRDLLLAAHPALSVDFLGITTQADKRLEVNVLDIGGKGAFVKELEEALLDGRADVAVHSMKDVPMVLPAGLCLPVMVEREDPRDAFVSNQFASILQLPGNASVGTSSLRRKTQLAAIRSDLNVQQLRGNINTRLRRLDEGHFDALILAGAGLKRMSFANRIRAYLSVDDMLPAAGQGALGLECREGDTAVMEVIKVLNDQVTSACVQAERAMCRALNGGCHVPVGAYAHLYQGELILKGLVGSQNGIRMLRIRLTGDPADAEAIGEQAARSLLDQGAETLLKEFR